jgi:hypothetical protein
MTQTSFHLHSSATSIFNLELSRTKISLDPNFLNGVDAWTVADSHPRLSLVVVVRLCFDMAAMNNDAANVRHSSCPSPLTAAVLLLCSQLGAAERSGLCHCHCNSPLHSPKHETLMKGSNEEQVGTTTKH